MSTAQQLRLGPDLVLPALEAQTQTLVVYGGKGMGKTNFAAILAEELAKLSLRFAWMDPVGVAWGIKHSHDGRGPGVQVLILGGIHGDLPIEPSAGALVADFVVDEDVSIIIDISRKASGTMWSQGEKIRFVRDYTLRLFERQGEERRPLMQIIDEAGRFVPQQAPKGAPHIAECIGAIEQLVELGRNVGVGVALITQRSARMNKSVSELAEMMVAFRTVGPRSIDAIIDWFGEHVPKPQWVGYVERLRKLPRGTALVVSPGWLDLEGEFMTRARETFDSSDTPVAGKQRKPRGKGAQVDKDKYLARLAETVEKAQANDPKKLHQEVARLTALVEQRENEVVEAVRRAQSAEAQVVEIEVVPPEVLEALRNAIARSEQIEGSAHDAVVAGKHALQNAEAIAAAGYDKRAQVGERGSIRMEAFGPAVPPPLVSLPPAPAPPAAVPSSDGGSDIQLKKGAREILETLAAMHPARMTRRQVAQHVGIKSTGSTLSSYLSNLRKAGLIDEDGNELAVSQAGWAWLGSSPPAPKTPAEIREMWRSRLKKGAREMLDALVANYPAGIDRVDLAERLGINPAGSTLSSYLSNLRTNELITESGSVLYASEHLIG